MSMDLYARLLEQLQTLQPHERIIILHPNFRFRHRLAHTLLALPYTCPIVFDIDRLPATVDVHRQIRIFTQHFATPPELYYFIFFNDVDLFPGDYLVELLLSLLSEFDTSIYRFILNARYAPHHVLYHPHLKARTRLLPVHDTLLMLNYPHRAPKPLVLEVMAFGQGRAYLNARLIEWPGEVPRQLFFYFIDHQKVLAEDVFKILWPTKSRSQATNIFHVINGQIKKTLNNHRLTDYRKGYYHLSSQFEIYYDVAHFHHLLDNLDHHHDTVRQHQLEQALYLYQADFLRDVDNAWVNARRAELLKRYHAACAALADIYEKQGERLKAMRMLLQIFKTDRLRDDVALRLMRLHHQLANYEAAKKVYALHAAALDDHAGAAPSAAVQALYQRISTMS